MTRLPSICLSGAARLALVFGLGLTVSATAAEPSVALVLGVKGSRVEEALKVAPGVTFLVAQYQNGDPQTAAEIVTSTLSAHPDLAGTFSTNDQGAIGAVTGLRQAGAIGKFKLVAHGSAAAKVAALKNEQITVLIAQDPRPEGEMSVEIAKKVLDGAPFDKSALAETVAIQADTTVKADRYEYKSDCSLSY